MEPVDPGLLVAVAAPVAVFDGDGRVRFCNPPFAALVGGASADDVAGDGRALLRPDGVASLERAWASLAAGASDAPLVLACSTPAGGTVTLSCKARLGRTASGSPPFLVATVVSSESPARHDKLRDVLALAPFGILILESDGSMTFNHRAEEILGITLLPEGGSEQYLPLLRRLDGAPLTRDELPSTRALRQGEAVAAEELLVCRPDGTQARIVESAGMARGPDGEVVRSVVMLQDITAHTASRTACAVYAGIVSLAADAIIAVDTDQRIIVFNDGAVRMFGWSAQEAIGQPLDILLPPRVRARHRVYVDEFASGPANARRMAEGRPSVIGLRKNGEEFSAEAGISRAEVEGTTLMAVVVRDITERKRRENEQRFLAHAGATLASSLDYQETLSNVARLAVPVLADCCVVELLERTVRRLKVVHFDPTKAQLAADLEAIQVSEPRTHPLWRVLAEQRSVLMPEFPPGFLEELAPSPEHLRLVQELAPVSLMAVPLAARGRVLGALTFVSVHPERIYGEHELRLAEELARRAAMAMDNSQLYAVSQQASRARDEVLGVVAHDLRNPLFVIKTAAETALLIAPDMSAELRETIEDISRATGQANRLIQDLLDITRLESGRTLVVELRECRPEELLRDAFMMMRAAAESASIELTVAASEDLPPVEADHDRILQVFSNLAGNAIKFTPKGGRVQLAARRAGDEVCFSVSDTGRGLAGDDLPHIFDRFWQARRADRRGVGLGLAIVKAIVEAHEGRIWVESELGVGTTFFFTLGASGVEAERSMTPARRR